MSKEIDRAGTGTGEKMNGRWTMERKMGRKDKGWTDLRGMRQDLKGRNHGQFTQTLSATIKLSVFPWPVIV